MVTLSIWGKWVREQKGLLFNCYWILLQCAFMNKPQPQAQLSELHSSFVILCWGVTKVQVRIVASCNKFCAPQQKNCNWCGLVCRIGPHELLQFVMLLGFIAIKQNKSESDVPKEVKSPRTQLLRNSIWKSANNTAKHEKPRELWILRRRWITTNVRPQTLVRQWKSTVRESCDEERRTELQTTKQSVFGPRKPIVPQNANQIGNLVPFA